MKIPDDPIIDHIQRTGYPPWLFADMDEIIDADFEEIDEDAGGDPGRKENT